MIILDYLSDNDKIQFSYVNTIERMEGHNLIHIDTREDLISRFEAYEFEDNQVVILAHGGPRGICKTVEIDDSFITWQELLNSIENIDVNIELTLNLCAVCNSVFILDFVIPVNIANILYSKTNVSSIHAALELSENNFKIRINHFEDEEGDLVYSYHSRE